MIEVLFDDCCVDVDDDIVVGVDLHSTEEWNGLVWSWKGFSLYL